MSPLSPTLTNNNDDPTAEDKDDVVEVVDVLIIGAGWAGLTTAKELLTKNSATTTTKIKILEGRSTYGGRCRSEPMMMDETTIAEYGAQWIHGARAKTNPMYKLALEAATHNPSIRLKRSSYSSQAVYQSSSSTTDEQQENQESTTSSCCERIDQTKYDFMYNYLMEGKGGFFKYQERRQDHDNKDITMRQCANDYLEKIDATKEQRRWLEYILESEIVQEYSGSLETTSMYWWDMDEDDLGGDVEIAGTGYKGLLDYYVCQNNSIPSDVFQFNSRVIKIEENKDDDLISVHYTTTTTTEEEEEEEEDPTNNNNNNNNQETRMIRAKKVVVTVPLGILQAKKIQFQPELPIAKQKAIDGIGMGLLNKCLFLWDEKDIPNLPWPHDCEWIERIANLRSPPPDSDDDTKNDLGFDDTRQGLWTEYYNLVPVTGRPILCAFTAGLVAQEVEQWTDKEIQQSAWKALEYQFGVNKIPPPKQVIVTKWGQDPWTLGSYTYNNIGGKHSNRKKLMEPIWDNKLFFAGEACHSQHFGTTHGAMMSGINVAKQIQKQSNNNNGGKLKQKGKKAAAAMAKQLLRG